MNIGPRKTVASITSGLTRMVQDLDALQEANKRKIEQLSNERAQLTAKITEQSAESAKAKKIAAKISDLLDA